MVRNINPVISATIIIHSQCHRKHIYSVSSRVFVVLYKQNILTDKKRLNAVTVIKANYQHFLQQSYGFHKKNDLCRKH